MFRMVLKLTYRIGGMHTRTKHDHMTVAFAGSFEFVISQLHRSGSKVVTIGWLGALGLSLV